MPRLGRIIILTGEIGSGKSTICLKILERLRETALDVTGIICPPIFTGSKKTGIELLDLHSRQRRQLALLNSLGTDGIQTHRWSFNEDTLRWGNTILGAATPCDVLIIDELGPLEFDRGLGFTNGLPQLDAGEFDFAIVVIRTTLVEKARSRWPSCEVIIVNVENRDILSQKLFEQIKK